jgi:hypothetical protein
MRNLLEQLEIERCAYVREHREPPMIRLERRGDTTQTCQLVDVGSDYIEIGMQGAKNRQKITRDAIVTVMFLAKHGG